MAFSGYLDNAAMHELVMAATDGELFEVPRAALLAGIPRGFVAALKKPNDSLGQFTSDLVAINQVERMADGVVPIVKLLQNSAFELKQRGRAESDIFARQLSQVANVASGVPPLPDPAALPELIHNEVVIGSDDTLDLSFLMRGLETAKAVARVTVPRFEHGNQVRDAQGGPWVMHGTSWLIAPGLAITNHHVVNARLAEESSAAPEDFALQASKAVLAFDLDATGAPATLASVAALISTSPDLDYALLDLSDAPERPIPLIAADPVVFGATTRMAVNIIQHPRGEHKQVAFRNNLITGADAETLRYFTDTDFGSSGSPVCNDLWEVVALHRGARHALHANYMGKSEAYVNFGSQIQAILSHLGERDSTTADRIRTAQLNSATTR